MICSTASCNRLIRVSLAALRSLNANRLPAYPIRRVNLIQNIFFLVNGVPGTPHSISGHGLWKPEPDRIGKPAATITLAGRLVRSPDVFARWYLAKFFERE
jgi:hypothetical protein